jgi:hypothetical protein
MLASVSLLFVKIGSVVEACDSFEPEGCLLGVRFRSRQCHPSSHGFGGRDVVERSDFPHFKSRIACMIICRAMRIQSARQNSGMASSDEDISTIRANRALSPTIEYRHAFASIIREATM